MVIDISILLEICRSLAICKAAGATIDDAKGEMKVKDDVASAAAHFLRSGQL